MGFGYFFKVVKFILIELLNKFGKPQYPVIYCGSESRQDVAKRILEEVTDICIYVSVIL